jgi:hypothetical protein
MWATRVVAAQISVSTRVVIHRQSHAGWFVTIDGREVRSRSGEEVSVHICLGHPEVVAWLKQDLARMVRQ